MIQKMETRYESPGSEKEKNGGRVDGREMVWVILYKKMDGNPKKGGRLGGIDDDDRRQ